MKPPPFEYHAPRSLTEALALLAEHGDEARPLAGGQSLIPAMNFRLAQPAVLVDLNGIDELAYLRRGDDGGLRVGAMTRQRVAETHPEVASAAPLLAATLPSVAHPQIRNRGTVGGSIAHADPAAELPAVAVAAGARCRLRASFGERWVAAEDFYTGLFETALRPGEMLVEVAFPSPVAGDGCAFHEMARRHGDYALVGVAVALRLQNGRVDGARIALLSVGDGPVLARGAARCLVGEAPHDSVLRAAAAAAGDDDIDPPGDLHASAAYRRHLARVLTERALRAAVIDAGGIVSTTTDTEPPRS